MKDMQSEEYAHRAAPFTNRTRDYTSISSAESGIIIDVIEGERLHDATLTVVEHSTDAADALELLHMLGLVEVPDEDD